MIVEKYKKKICKERERKAIKVVPLKEANEFMRRQYEPNKLNRARPEQKRGDQDKVFAALFRLFAIEETMYFEDIQTKTGQPSAFLRRCLREIAIETQEGKHKKWSIKCEYKF